MSKLSEFFAYANQFSYYTLGQFRAIQDVGLMVVHPEKGVYVGHDKDGVTPRWLQASEIPSNFPIPVFRHQFVFRDLKGVSADDTDAVHHYQVRCEYYDINGRTFTGMAFDERGQVKQEDLRLPNKTYHIYHYPPKLRNGFVRSWEAVRDLDLPFLREKAPQMKVL